ncbi:uncharacterized protein LOC111410169 isoform X3 [Olea europaea var. sylvestris]|uniref:uncharacterized protein LOC111410169 isoform X3 n=1 Tax=Olea europaea var. sylvestris TaxID=158386 RepID=UPI000C1D36A9|nr:uncharacterized protein LOC111410169 isoform X3 [Olea europaea var. sylvestris]
MLFSWVHHFHLFFPQNRRRPRSRPFATRSPSSSTKPDVDSSNSGLETHIFWVRFAERLTGRSTHFWQGQNQQKEEDCFAGFDFEQYFTMGGYEIPLRLELRKCRGFLFRDGGCGLNGGWANVTNLDSTGVPSSSRLEGKYKAMVASWNGIPCFMELYADNRRLLPLFIPRKMWLL